MNERLPIQKRKFTKANSDTWDWIIVEKEKEVGRCRFTLEKDHMYIDDLVVQKEYRKKGIGSYLLQAVEGYAIVSGYAEIRGSAVAYEKDTPNYRGILKSWWEEKGYIFRIYSPSDESRHVGNFHKELPQPGGGINSVCSAHSVDTP